MLVESPVAVLTPFAPQLPSAADQNRIASGTPRAFCTADPSGARVSDEDPIVLRKLRSIPRRVRRVVGDTGHVRIRMRFSDPTPIVDLFSGAFELRITS